VDGVNVHDVDSWEATGGVNVKGKGHMLTFLWRQPDGFLQRAVNPAALTQPALGGGEMLLQLPETAAAQGAVGGSSPSSSSALGWVGCSQALAPHVRLCRKTLGMMSCHPVPEKLLHPFSTFPLSAFPWETKHAHATNVQDQHQPRPALHVPPVPGCPGPAQGGCDAGWGTHYIGCQSGGVFEQQRCPGVPCSSDGASA
jgi:hypothetical protein